VAVKPYYEEDGIAIYHGDCAVIAPALGMTFDLLCTDPPYGIGEARNKRAGKRPGRAIVASRDYGMATWDDAPPSQALIDSLRTMARWQCIFGCNYFTLPPSSCWLVWDKENGASDFADAELAWTNYTSAVRLRRHRWAGMLQADMANKEERVHPTQKPLAVMSWAIGLCPVRPSSVFDPFMGSGTALRVAKDLGMRAVGIEAEERYCEIAARRLGQGVLALGAVS
jgi:site-specific DNA-methyltransferase (adenine-specific)